MKEEIWEVVLFLRDLTGFTEIGAHIPKGILLVGPPGTGKTLLPELAMGAIGEGGAMVVDEEEVRGTGISPAAFARVETHERAALHARLQRYRGGRPAVPLGSRTVVVVADGIATGSTARAACRVMLDRGAGRVVLAVPVAPADWTSRLHDAADELVAVATPEPSTRSAPGTTTSPRRPTTDDQVMAYLDAAAPVTPDPRPRS